MRFGGEGEQGGVDRAQIQPRFDFTAGGFGVNARQREAADRLEEPVEIGLAQVGGINYVFFSTVTTLPTPCTETLPAPVCVEL